MFPSLNMIRITEDVNVFEVVVEFAKRQEWKLRLEDRLGHAILGGRA